MLCHSLACNTTCSKAAHILTWETWLRIYFYYISLFYRDQIAQPEKPASPKFIVTLDGVPSPPGYLSDQEEEDMYITEGLKPIPQNICAGKGLKGLRAQQMQIVTRQLDSSDGNYSFQQDLILLWWFDCR